MAQAAKQCTAHATASFLSTNGLQRDLDRAAALGHSHAIPNPNFPIEGMAPDALTPIPTPPALPLKGGWKGREQLRKVRIREDCGLAPSPGPPPRPPAAREGAFRVSRCSTNPYPRPRGERGTSSGTSPAREGAFRVSRCSTNPYLRPQGERGTLRPVPLPQGRVLFRGQSLLDRPLPSPAREGPFVCWLSRKGASMWWCS